MIERLSDILREGCAMWERSEHSIPADLSIEAIYDRYAGHGHGTVGHGTGKRAENAALHEPFHDFIGCNDRTGENLLITGENLPVAKTLLSAIRAGTLDSLRLIYMDPPFFSGVNYTASVRVKTGDGTQRDLPIDAFRDVWNEGGKNRDDAFANYLTQIAARIAAARDLLSDDGVLWLHLDHHAVHYVKLLADEIFGGSQHLVNEVVWCYKSGGATKKRFARKHDTLLFYAKHPKNYKFYPKQEKSYNRALKPYRFKGVKEYRDEIGWYTLVNMRDVWQIDMVGRTSRERTGYTTQKPEELLARIISACTDEGDLCADLYGGSGTLAAVCTALRRPWIVCDNNPVATAHAERRLTGLGAAFTLLRMRRSVADPEIVEDCEAGGNPEADAAGEPNANHSDALDKAADFIQITCSEQGLCVQTGGKIIFSIGVDTDYDGVNFRPQALCYGQDRLVVPRTACTGPVAVRVQDVFGNCTEKIHIL